MMLLDNSPIVVYGAGFTAEKFLCLNRHRYKISFFIDRNAGRMFHGFPVYTLDEALHLIKDELIVVMAKNDSTENDIILQLNKHGYKEYQNYIPLRKLDKKLAILYGNCHMNVLEDYLYNTPYFYDNYYIDRYYVGDSNEKKREPSDQELARCDLLVTQDIRDNNDLGVMGCDLIKSKTNGRVIVIPNLFGCNLFFPQAVQIDDVKDIHVGNTAVISGDEIGIIQWITGWRDENIERMYEEGMNASEILKHIDEDDIYTKDEIRSNFEVEIKKIKQREKLCDVKIVDYIQKNYKRMKVFYDPNHPSKEILWEMGRQILELLGLNYIKEYNGMTANNGGEIFIYGCVRRALGLTFEEIFIKDNAYLYTLHNRKITREEYVEEYLSWHYPV